MNFLNLKQAQTRYVEEIFKMIPADVETILDVGCGSGEIASQLIERGYKVDCVCPPSVLSHFAKEKLAGRAELFECRFEELETERRYDLIFFSESFQFIGLQAALKQSRRFGRKYAFIADVFRMVQKEKGPMGGGHKYWRFSRAVQELGLTEIANVDVTAFTAPHFDLERKLMDEFVQPMTMVSKRMITGVTRLAVGFLAFVNRAKICKVQTRYMNPARNRDAFARYNAYRFILLRLPD